jgi:tripeptidyl-peptidase-1
VAHRQADLNLFYSNLQRQIPSGYAPVVDSIDGGTISVPESEDNNGEADLDIEYAIALGK